MGKDHLDNKVTKINGENYDYCVTHDLYYSENARLERLAMIRDEPNHLMKVIIRNSDCPLCLDGERKSLCSSMAAMGEIDGP